LGRWITQDPLGFVAGDTNLYRYVTNKPLIATDPNGTQIRRGTLGTKDDVNLVLDLTDEKLIDLVQSNPAAFDRLAEALGSGGAVKRLLSLLQAKRDAVSRGDHSHAKSCRDAILYEFGVNPINVIVEERDTKEAKARLDLEEQKRIAATDEERKAALAGIPDAQNKPLLCVDRCIAKYRGCMGRAKYACAILIAAKGKRMDAERVPTVMAYCLMAYEGACFSDRVLCVNHC
jgi:hypothetical protein